MNDLGPVEMNPSRHEINPLCLKSNKFLLARASRISSRFWRSFIYTLFYKKLEAAPSTKGLKVS